MFQSNARRTCAAIAFLYALGASAYAQGAPQGRFEDTLLDNMVGHWHLTGEVMHQPADHSVDAKWVLDHSFLRLHEKSNTAGRSGQPAYEAFVFIGFDRPRNRYVAHWLDVFGGHPSATLGHAQRNGDTLEFAFDYPESAFRTTFRWDAQSHTWEWLMQNRNAQGDWDEFAKFTMARTNK
jgi:Protein of unknown function (DUF1579)